MIVMPQQAWNKKRERQYEHIKDSLKDKGRSESTAEEIAARTVNKPVHNRVNLSRLHRRLSMTSLPLSEGDNAPISVHKVGRKLSSMKTLSA